MNTDENWNELAHSKMVRILGNVEADQLMVRTLSRMGVDALTSADDLHRFAKELTESGGIAGAVGAMLSLTAVLRGAAAVH